MKALKEFKYIYGYDVVIFDLDDTLYPEKQFLFSAYREISKEISLITKIDAGIYSKFLINTFNSVGRKSLFDKLIGKFDLSNIITMDKILFILRTHKISLDFYPGIPFLIKELIKQNKKVFVLTNGNPIQQENKVKNLNISKQFPQIKVIYANEYEPKPSPFCVKEIINRDTNFSVNTILIGDSKTDELTAFNSNIYFINIQKLPIYGNKQL